MSSTALEPQPAAETPPPPADDASPKLPDASSLVDQVPPHLKASRVAAGFTLVLGLIYLVFCLKPIWHTDIWGHLSYGQVLWQHKALPAEEPLLPLAEGMPFVDTAWLSQLASYATLRSLGLAGLQGLTAISVTLTCAFLLFRSFATTKSVLFSLLGVAVLLWFDWNQFIVLRPQLFGLACFAGLLYRLTGKPDRSDWVTIPVLFLVWTNMHGSFPVGLGLLAAFTIGRAVDVVRRSGQFASLTHDRKLGRLVLLTELAFAATLINPYGPFLYQEVLTFSSNPNLQSLTEWQPLDVRGWTGSSLLALLAVAAMLYRVTPRRVAAWESLVLIGLAASTFWSMRMLAWFAPVAAYLIAIHAHASWRAWRHDEFIPAPSPRAGLWTVVALGLAWIFFGYSPLGLRVIHGKTPKVERAVSEYTPVGAVQYLHEHPPVGQVFNTYEWGDYLQFAGPADLKIFVNSHAHAAPKEVWQHYLQVIQMSGPWQETLERYGVNTVIVDRAIRDNLIKALKDDDKWTVGYEDHVATVFVRKKPIGDFPTENPQ